MKLNKPRANKKPYQKFFTNRIINAWNSLPEDIVTASTQNIFKNKLDSHYYHITYSTNIPEQTKHRKRQEAISSKIPVTSKQTKRQ